MADQTSNLLHTLEPKRDSYGFALRPQHAQRYREYANIYKEEEEERSDKWKNFIEQLTRYAQPCSSHRDHIEASPKEVTEQEVEVKLERPEEGDDTSNTKSSSLSKSDLKKEVQLSKETKANKVQTWVQIRSSLCALENIMSSQVKKRKNMKDEPITIGENHFQLVEKTGSSKASEDLEEKDCVNDVLDESKSASIAENSENGGISESANTTDAEGNLALSVSCSAHTAMEEFAVDDGNSYIVDAGDPEKHGSVDTSETKMAVNVNDIGEEKAVGDGFYEELECLVQGGVPKDIRGEVWQAFVGVKARRVERYYHDLLAQERNASESMDGDNLSGAARKWKRQIEKDIPRTFPGHPALDENGRNSLRRLLLAYARHNPSVGYCQAMNFFAGLLLLLMPEENAFWTLVGILDDYFNGYYTEEMIESQVDQLVFEELMRERFPKLGGMDLRTLVSFHFCQYASLGKCSPSLGCASI